VGNGDPCGQAREGRRPAIRAERRCSRYSSTGGSTRGKSAT
jgi:hypothetical protein